MKKENIIQNLPGQPHNEDAEKVTLGSLILDNSFMSEAADLLTPEHFYCEKNRTIYGALLTLWKEKKPIDLVVLADFLKTSIEPTYLTQLVSDTPTSANFPHYAEILKAHYVRRLVIKESHRHIEKATSGDDYSELLSEVSQRFSKLAQTQIKSDIITPSELAKTGNKDFIDRVENKIAHTGISSGYEYLDRLCGGFGRGDLVIVAGATGIGKSSLLLDIVNRVCLKDGRAGAYFSLEMGQYEIFYRLLAKMTGLHLGDIKAPRNLKEKGVQQVIHAVAKISDSRFFLDTTPVLNINSLLAKARKIRAKDNIEFICVDYLQLISCKSKDRARHEILSEITIELKQLARELEIPVIAGAQLNRSALDIDGPRLIHMGESFAINQHADTVILISKDQSNAVLDVAKARQAAGGKFELSFDYQTVSFVERKDTNDIRNY